MNSAITSSAALIELKTDLTQLSNTLHVIYDLMQADMSQVNSAWQDVKYEEFRNNYEPQIKKCEDIAVRYAEWCERVLSPTIENALAAEQVDMSVGSVAGTGGDSGASTGASGTLDGFNL